MKSKKILIYIFLIIVFVIVLLLGVFSKIIVNEETFKYSWNNYCALILTIIV